MIRDETELPPLVSITLSGPGVMSTVREALDHAAVHEARHEDSGLRVVLSLGLRPEGRFVRWICSHVDGDDDITAVACAMGGGLTNE